MTGLEGMKNIKICPSTMAWKEPTFAQGGDTNNSEIRIQKETVSKPPLPNFNVGR